MNFSTGELKGYVYWAAAALLGALWMACSAESKRERVEPTECESDADCGKGAACSEIAPLAYGLDDFTQSVCWNEECESENPDCGTPSALCGHCVCQPSCEDKVCGDDYFDGCNGFCHGFCDTLEPGCHHGTDCPSDHRCFQHAGDLYGHDDEVSVCVPEFCFSDDELYRNECGFEGARCGSVCAPEPEPCPEMECGTSPSTGDDCGTCSEGYVCNLQWTCVVPDSD